MVIDSSALVAIVLGEPEAEACLDVMDANPALSVSPVTVVESTMVLHSRVGADGVQELHRLMSEYDIRIVAVEADQAATAADAWLRFGKGRHPARLNLGDVFSYALATTRGEPLLFKGEDFIRTDVRVALV